MYLGVDEAGRGPVIGPLVIACIAAQTEDLVASLGATDSKKLSAKKREDIAGKLTEFPHAICIFEAHEIDARTGTLNDLELEGMVKVSKLVSQKCDTMTSLIIDAPTTNIQAFQTEFLSKFSAPLLAMHKADEKHPIVGAASILAKVTRDAAIEALKQEWGIDFGSGYPSDPKTQAFIREHAKNPKYAKHIRFTWKTIGALAQKTLGSYS